MLNDLAFGCGWASVAIGHALGRLALGRLALGLALAAQLLQRGWGGKCRRRTIALAATSNAPWTRRRALAQVRLAPPSPPPL